MKKLENSWHLEIPDLNNNGNMLHHYFCNCGHKHTLSLMSRSRDFPYLVCPKCNNNYYIDITDFKDASAVYYWKDFKFSCELFEDEDGWYMEYYYLIPRLDGATDKFKASREIIVKITLFKDGRLNQHTIMRI